MSGESLLARDFECLFDFVWRKPRGDQAVLNALKELRRKSCVLANETLTESFFQYLHVDHSCVGVENNCRTINKLVFSRLNDRGRIGMRSLRRQIYHDGVARFWIRRSDQRPEMFFLVARLRQHHCVADCEHDQRTPKTASASATPSNSSSIAAISSSVLPPALRMSRTLIAIALP